MNLRMMLVIIQAPYLEGHGDLVSGGDKWAYYMGYRGY